MIFPDWSVPGEGVISHAATPDYAATPDCVSCGITSSGFAAFWGLEMKHNWSLNDISRA